MIRVVVRSGKRLQVSDTKNLFHFPSLLASGAWLDFGHDGCKTRNIFRPLVPESAPADKRDMPLSDREPHGLVDVRHVNRAWMRFYLSHWRHFWLIWLTLISLEGLHHSCEL